jgi:DedD protein
MARAQARRRLIGAVLLLGVGVVAFPLLFETEPRPIPVDLPIVIPPRDGAPPLAMPAPAPVASAAVGATAAAPVVPAPASEPLVPARPAPAAMADPPPPPAPEAAATEPKVATAPAKPADDGARARALLEGKGAAASPAKPSPAPQAAAGGYVVQIGAFAEGRTVREVRAKARKAGLETYTQAVNVASGEVTRVRVGPFPRREEADAAAAKALKAGLPASVLKL